MHTTDLITIVLKSPTADYFVTASVRDAWSPGNASPVKRFEIPLQKCARA